MKTTHRKIKIFSSGLLAAFFIVTGIYFFIIGDSGRAVDTLLMTVLLILPFAAERLFRFKIRLSVFIFYMCHILCAMLGHSLRFYFIFPWWDNMLHLFGGALLAIIGFSIPKYFAVRSKNNRVFYGVFALCFAMAVSLAWEFVEYGADNITGTDMQQDTVVTSITTNKLSGGTGMVERIKDIHDTTVNGESLGIDGYLELGLIDTMTDTLLGTAGAMVGAVVLSIQMKKEE